LKRDGGDVALGSIATAAVVAIKGMADLRELVLISPQMAFRVTDVSTIISAASKAEACFN
jgi:hypothetical protein